jgi:hypothetical protein
MTQNVGFEVHTVEVMKRSMLWDITPYSPLATCSSETLVDFQWHYIPKDRTLQGCVLLHASNVTVPKAANKAPLVGSK